MTKLSSIQGIGKTSLELLESAGFSHAEALAKTGVDELCKELERANGMLKIAKKTPGRASVEKWVAAARKLTGVEDPLALDGFASPVNYETSPHGRSLLGSAPFAIPLPARYLVEQKLTVGDIPSGILFNRYSGDLDIRVEDRMPGMPAIKPARQPKASHEIRITEPSEGRLDIDLSKVKSTEDLAVESVLPSTTTNQDERVALIRGPKPETNAGRDPQSRRYIRGVLHGQPYSMRIGAIITLLLVVLLPVGVISAFLLLLSAEVPVHFSWVPKGLLIFPVSLPLIGLAYLIWGINGSCRICGQRQFLPKVCLKNAKAHYIPGLGHIIPLCLHMLLFSWFRCTYCGTPVRLKK
jgi:hypothetical protein